MKRGDVVLVDYPYTSGGAKVRPALVIQDDRYNDCLFDTIVAQISSNTSRIHEASQLLIDRVEEPDSGLLRNSAVICTNILTLNQSDVLRPFMW